MRIAVDLTPVLPGGQNGGIKPLVLGLLCDLIALAPQIEFVLLTSYTTDAELAVLDAENVRRQCVIQPAPGLQKASPPGPRNQIRFQRRVRFALTRVLPPGVMLKIEQAYLAATGQQPRPITLPNALGANLLFSPFMTQSFHQPGLPSVSLVHDVQFLRYPRFFRAEQRALLLHELQHAARLSDHLVCTSAFVRRTILDNLDVPPSRVSAIQPRTVRHLSNVKTGERDHVLARLGLDHGSYLLYPGNFRPHKNHGMLVTAFGVYLAQHPDSELRLVCPGFRSSSFEELLQTTRVMGLDERVVFPGFVSDTELAALYQSCRAVIFPSLDEGVGLPVMEAIAFQKPVLCGGYPSLYEAAGDAAVYFNPRLLSDIVDAIELAAHDPDVLRRAAGAGDGPQPGSSDPLLTAREYLRLFSEVAA